MLDSNVKTLFRVKETKGALGVEIEVEGKHLPVDCTGWRLEHDGSLRGNSMEYVLRKPGSLRKVRGWLDNLDKAYRDCGTVVDESVRAGVHVHVNVQDLTMRQVFNTMTTYLVLEPLLVEWCGDSRVGNHFCLRAGDAEYLIEQLQRTAQFGRVKYLKTDALRYASMNVYALAKYGSLEFRAMRGTRDLDAIFTWANMLFNMKQAAAKFRNPQEVVALYSGMCVDDFLDRVLGDLSGELKALPDYQQKVLDGIRLAQEVAYCCDWKGEAEEFVGPSQVRGTSAYAIQINDDMAALNVVFNKAVPDPPELDGDAIRRAAEQQLEQEHIERMQAIRDRHRERGE